MSAPKRAVILSPAAQADFTDVLLYSWQQWGEAQRDRYEASLERAIAGLADRPDAGVHRPRLFPGCRGRPVERPVLSYQIMNDTVEVVRILHERTDPTRHFRS